MDDIEEGTELEQYWRSHLRYWNNLPLFPREYGLYREEVYKEDFFHRLNFEAKITDCYTSVYSEGQLTRKIYDTFYLEAREAEHGNVDMEQILLDRDIIRGVLENLGIAYRCFYSGGRSYHFYIDFEPIPIENLSVAARNFLIMIDLPDMFDMHTVGNKRAMARIPYTLNTRYGKFAVYSMASTPEELDYISANMLFTEKPVMALQPTEFLKYLVTDESLDYGHSYGSILDFDEIYPECVINIIHRLNAEHHAKHNERIHLAAFLNKLGKSEDEIVDVFKEASDFNRAVAQYQVRSILDMNYSPYGCRRVKLEMGDLCPYTGTGGYCRYIRGLRVENDSTET